MFPNQVTQEDADLMNRPVTDSEIKSAMYDISDDKAPGLDGYTSKFTKKLGVLLEMMYAMLLRSSLRKANYREK